MKKKDYERFKNLTFDKFKELAKDDSLSCYEKIGFPDSYRRGKEGDIFNDILSKLNNLHQKNRIVLDIGPGCSELPGMLIDLCEKNNHTLLLVDSPEMLNCLPDKPFIKKYPGLFPLESEALLGKYIGKIDVILAYSVLHYIYIDTNLFDFLDRCLELLNYRGEMLIGDIPNVSKRKRFFTSPTGVLFHQKFMKTDTEPKVAFNNIEAGNIDDSVIMGILLRARSSGFDAYIMPQADGLPMANRREDLYIKKP